MGLQTTQSLLARAVVSIGRLYYPLGAGRNRRDQKRGSRGVAFPITELVSMVLAEASCESHLAQGPGEGPQTLRRVPWSSILLEADPPADQVRLFSMSHHRKVWGRGCGVGIDSLEKLSSSSKKHSRSFLNHAAGQVCGGRGLGSLCLP